MMTIKRVITFIFRISPNVTVMFQEEGNASPQPATRGQPRCVSLFIAKLILVLEIKHWLEAVRLPFLCCRPESKSPATCR